MALLVSVFWAGTAVGVDLSSVDSLLDQGKAESTLQALRQESAEDGQAGAKIFWRRARARYELGRTSENKKERSHHLRLARQWAEQAIEADPQNDEGYKWLAITCGALAEDVDIETQIRLSRQVKLRIEGALALDPDDDISLLVLSRWHYKIASLGFWARSYVRLVYGALPEASFEKAEELLWQAIAEKDRIAHRYSLAKLYHRMGRRNEALEQLRITLTLSVTFAEEEEDLVKARKKLMSWQ